MPQFVQLRLVQDGPILVFVGAGSYTLSLSQQPAQILNIYFVDTTVAGIPKTVAETVVVVPADYTPAISIAVAKIVVSYDASQHLLIRDNTSGLLTSGHNYRAVVQYLVNSN